MELIILSFLQVLFIGVILSLHRSNRASASFVRLVGAHRALMAWCDSHPGMYIGHHARGKQLLKESIKAWDEFLRLHPYVKNDEHREFLVRLSKDLPP